MVAQNYPREGRPVVLHNRPPGVVRHHRDGVTSLRQRGGRGAPRRVVTTRPHRRYAACRMRFPLADLAHLARSTASGSPAPGVGAVGNG